MKLSDASGFTIIETMLFFAISGLLIMGVLIGTGTAINAQRYRDSAWSLQSQLQHQYSLVANASNERDTSWTCDSDGPAQGVGTSGVGQSDCVLLGKYISTDDGTQLQIKNVVGYIPGGITLASDDINAFRQIDITVSQISTETYNTEWGTTITPKESSSPLSFSVLIVRSPVTGVIRTFINPTNSVNDSEIVSMIDQSSLASGVHMCVDPGGLFSANEMAVLLNANGTSGSAVEILGENSGC